MDIQEKIDVLVAYRDGKQIECTTIEYNDWWLVEKPAFNFNAYKYRVKKELEVIYEVKTLLGYHAFIKSNAKLDTDTTIKKFVEVLDE